MTEYSRAIRAVLLEDLKMRQAPSADEVLWILEESPSGPGYRVPLEQRAHNLLHGISDRSPRIRVVRSGRKVEIDLRNERLFRLRQLDLQIRCVCAHAPIFPPSSPGAKAGDGRDVSAAFAPFLP